jgi:hypothetical protein
MDDEQSGKVLAFTNSSASAGPSELETGGAVQACDGPHGTNGVPRNVPTQGPGEAAHPAAEGEADAAQRALIGHTLAVWQSRSARRLTPEDAREMIENMTGCFRLLLEWKARESTLRQSQAQQRRAA